MFTGRDASAHDLESVHALGVNGLISLQMINPGSFSIYFEEGEKKYEQLVNEEDMEYFALLFSTRAKDMDQTLMTERDDNQLNKAIKVLEEITPLPLGRSSR